jgi:NADPH:quinone reductase-like Zn-dependent oxidoreductase
MSQRALLLHEVGKSLAAGDRPIPQPSKNQLLVKVLVAGRRFRGNCTGEDRKTMLT